MATDQHVDPDAISKSKHKELPPIQTAFQEKPLPAIKEPPARPSKESGRSTPSSKRALDRGYRRLNPKSALYHLFSRPKVEKQRGFNEPGLTTPPVDLPDRVTPSPEPVIEIPSPTTVAPEHVYVRPGTSLSAREDPHWVPRSHTPACDGAPHRDESPTLPPLFDVYSISSKVTTAQSIDESPTYRITRPRKSNASHFVPAIVNEERRGSVDSTKGEKIYNRNARNSLTNTPFQRKIFALCDDGLILQYSETGGGERLPERALQLDSDSAAFACDLIPGRPYVLQIDQKAGITDTHIVPPQSLLTKIGFKGSLPRVGEHSMLLILDTAEELTSWMNAVRKRIHSLDENLIDLEKAAPDAKLSSVAPKLRIRQRGSVTKDMIPTDTLERTATDTSANQWDSLSRRGSITATSLYHSSLAEPRDPELRRDSNATVSRALTMSPEPRNQELRRGSNAAVSVVHNTLPESRNQELRRGSNASIAVNTNMETKERYPRRDSNAVASLKSQSQRDSKEKLRKMASIDTTGSHDSPLSIATHDSAISFGPEQTRQRNLREHNASQKSSIGSLNDELNADSPILPKSMVNLERAKPTPVVDRPRPDSFVADLPLLWPARKASDHPVLSKSRNDAKSSPTSAPAMKRLPLKVNPSSGDLSAPRQRPSPSSPPRPSISSSKSFEPSTRRPQRTPSVVKLSLFPTAELPPLPPPTAAPTRPLPPSPLTPGDNATTPQHRPLRRPTSIQVRANHAPFLSSLRPMASARPQLAKAESTPCLRQASTFPMVKEPQKPSSSPLPPLDLGMPIEALAPPAPPPSLPLPKLPPSAPQKALAV